MGIAHKGAIPMEGLMPSNRFGCGCQNQRYPILGIPLWRIGEFTTLFRTYFSGWIGITGG